METKSRVERYEKLRKKISNMDVYSFEEQEEVAKNLPPVSDASQSSETIDEPSSEVKKNTLSLSLDQLIASNENYQEGKEKKKTKALYKKKKHERIRKERSLTQGKILLMVTIPCALIVVLFVVLIFTGVI